MRLFRILIASLAITSLVAGMLLTIPPYLQGARLLSVQTGSMEPAFRAGDAVWVERAPVWQLSPGDVISYRSPADNKVVISHRLTWVDTTSGMLITKGDNEKLTDIPFHPGLVIGRVSHVLPGVGRPLDWLHKPLGLMLAVYFPGLLIILSEGKRVAAGIKRHSRTVAFT